MKKENSLDVPWQRVHVLFRNEHRLPFLRLFKKDFRHCALLFESKDSFLYLDTTLFRIETRVWTKPSSAISYFKKEGWIILTLPYMQTSSLYSFRLNWIDCVSVTKRFLGIKKWGIFTPFQLYKYLKKD
ncbi:MAG: hypothetical protein ACTSXV_00645 [Alphaproteobacteria bacterium]